MNYQKKDIYYERLLKVANSKHEDFLENGVFDFRRANVITETKPIFKSKVVPNCGTVGCKMHLFPFLFEDVSFNIGIVGHLIFPEDSLIDYFGLTNKEGDVLFYPSADEYLEITINGVTFKDLPDTATEEEVNANIKKFLKAKYGDSK